MPGNFLSKTQKLKHGMLLVCFVILLGASASSLHKEFLGVLIKCRWQLTFAAIIPLHLERIWGVG